MPWRVYTVDLFTVAETQKDKPACRSKIARLFIALLDRSRHFDAYNGTAPATKCLMIARANSTAQTA